MNKIEKYQTLMIFISMVMGLILGYVAIIERYAENFVTPLLFMMLIASFLNIPLKDYKKSLLNTKFTLTAVAINFIWTPLLIFLLGKLFLADAPILQLGLLMLMVTPCTDWYLIFTNLAKGNVALSASVLPINLVLQVILLPVYLLIFGGVSGSVDISSLLTSIFIMLIFPFGLAQLGKIGLNKLNSNEKKEKILNFFSSLQTILLALAIMSMFAAKGRTLLGNLNVVAILIIPIVAFYLISFGMAQFIGKQYRYSYEDTASLTLTTIAKNSPMTLGVALMAFPNEPLIHLIMIIEPLIELPVMMLIVKILLMIRKKDRESSGKEII